MPPAIPSDEERRLKALRSLSLLDSAPEERFDRLTRLAQRVFGVPVSLISLVDEHREWYKSRQGVEASESPRETSFCGHAILEEGPFIVPDSSRDPRFADNPAVQGDRGIRFYAGYPLKALDGSPVGMFCIKDVRPRQLTVADLRALRDLASMAEDEMNAIELNRALAQLASSEEKLRLLLDAETDGVIVYDGETRRIQDVNEAATRLYGYTREEFLKLSLLQITAEPEATLAAVPKVLDGSLKRLPLRLQRRKDGTTFPAEIATGTFRVNGRPMGLGTVRDISERKRMEEAVFQSEKLSAVGRLAAGVAHELNNPLSTILGYIQDITESLPEGEESPFRSVEREALRCRRLVGELLTFSRASQGESEDVDPAEVIRDSVALIQTKARLCRVEVKSALAPDLPAVRGNRNQLQQALVNLAANALDAMPDGGTLALSADRLAEPEGDWLLLRVADTGSGIPGEVLPHIFEPFFTTKPVGQGTGLGLALVHEIVQKHGGTIDVLSRPGATEFRLRLPASGRGARTGT